MEITCIHGWRRHFCDLQGGQMIFYWGCSGLPSASLWRCKSVPGSGSTAQPFPHTATASTTTAALTATTPTTAATAKSPEAPSPISCSCSSMAQCSYSWVLSGKSSPTTTTTGRHICAVPRATFATCLERWISQKPVPFQEMVIC